MNVNNMFYRLEKINFINEHLDNDELTKIVERLEKKNGKKLYDNQKNRLRPVSNSVKDNTQKDVSEVLREYRKFDKSINAPESTDKPGNSDLKKNSDANSRLKSNNLTRNGGSERKPIPNDNIKNLNIDDFDKDVDYSSDGENSIVKEAKLLKEYLRSKHDDIKMTRSRERTVLAEEEFVDDTDCVSDVSSDDDISIVSDRFSRRADFKRALEFTIKRAEVLHEKGSFDSYEYLKGGQFRSDAKSIYDSNNKIWMEAFWKYVSKKRGPWKISCVPKVFNNTEEWHRWFANYSSQLGMNMVPYDPFFKRAGLSFSIENLKLFGFRTELTYQEKKDRGLVSNSVYIPKVETSNKPKIPVAKPVDSYLENQVIYNGIPMVLGQGLYNFPGSGFGFSPQIGCYSNGGSW